jgi:phage shock protein PspC (stress-responsive transcriptional regulator)
MTSQPPHVPSPAGDEDPIGSTVRAMTAPPTHAPRPTALRTGILREPGRGPLGGVCAALAVAWGVPVRLVRVQMVLLALLGIGLVLYPVLVLALPGRVSTREGAQDRDGDRIRRGVGAGGDLVLAVAAIAGALLGIWWLLLLARYAFASLWILVPLALVGGVVIGIAATTAARARRAFVLAELARRAGITDQGELEDTIRAYRRSAPHAWDAEALRSVVREGSTAQGTSTGPTGPGAATGPAGTAAASPDPGTAGGGATGADPVTQVPGGRDPSRSRVGRRRRPTPPPGQARWSLLSATALLVATAVPLGALGLWPDAVTRMAPGIPVPQILAVGATAAVVTLVAGVLLIIGGRHGRRSRWTGVAGVLALVMVVGSTAWTRATDPADADPIVMHVSEYQPGYTISCPESGTSSWARPVVIDMTDLTLPGSTKKAEKAWRDLNGVPDDVPLSKVMDDEDYPEYDLSMSVWCDRPVGTVEVRMPDNAHTRVFGDMSVVVGGMHGSQPQDQQVWSSAVPVVLVQGQVGIGSVRWTGTTG